MSPPKVQTERTSKKIKAWQAGSALAMIAGVIVIFATADEAAGGFLLGFLLVTAGIGGVIVSSIAAWWHHG